jgi:outer membrane protein assembly factor BamB
MVGIHKPACLFVLTLAVALGMAVPAHADFLVSVSNDAGSVNEVQQYTDSGTFVGNLIPNSFPANGGLSTPEGLAYGPDGNLYVASFANGNVLAYNGQNGTYLGAFATSPQMVQSVDGLQFGPNGNLYVSNFNQVSGNAAIQEFSGPTTGTPGALVATFNVPYGNGSVGNGVSGPLDIAFAPNGNILVSSSATNEILQYNATTGAFLGALVPAGELGLNLPDGLAVDAAHNLLYVSSSNNNQILMFNLTTGAPVDTFALLPVNSFPVGVFVQPSGNILVAENGPGVIAQYAPDGTLLGTFGLAQMGGASPAGFPSYFTEAVVPEPSSIVLVGLGVVVLGTTTYRRRRAALAA